MRYGQRLILLFTALSVLGATPGYAQTCTAGDLQRAIQRLQDDQGRGATQASLKQCGEPAVDLLIRALSDPQMATRLAATQTLGQMGWVATSASPVLVAVAQGDPDLDLRRGAVQALSQIARSGQAQAEQWQGWQVMGGIEQEVLLWYDPQGQAYPLPDQVIRDMQTQLMAERRRAEAAEQRANRLAQRLRQLGIDPEPV